ncbi:Pyridoxal phosphate-dependent transferase major region subdomain 1 [Penicillium taxi]|uniref:Pyridoxal phosphate-dependent transferase major region subdomain 1 n=1 Tax=Penicillium taxi TaxID=168475 RepID=UPI0025454D0B|nr:Pyridoxal phosphate-dependent transferase major region subdomain 1 [Penicillium taxi]KAJ5901764.1 Pyridoxal phosphate-dependent transferase major region subdomain 1 [Penicillium taxi]
MDLPENIDLLRGWPNYALLPTADLLRSATTALTTPSIAADGLAYGPDEGYEPLRVHIAQWLESFYRPTGRITSSRICITGGASQNLAIVLQVFTDPVYTRNVWMVDPTYHLACRMMDDAGFAGRARAVPEDGEGIDLKFLERGLEASEREAIDAGNVEPKLKPARPWRKIYKHVIYCVPTFANPSGKIMSLGHREQLVRLARKYDALLVTDDVYDFLQWSSTTDGELKDPDLAFVPRLVDVDRYLDGGPLDDWGHTLSNGSFSKLIGPGARTGWAEASDKIAYGLSQAGSSRSGGAPSQLASTVVDQLFPDFLPQYLRHKLQPAYAERYHAIMAAIQKYLVPLGASADAPSATVAGGYFIWITLPSPILAADVVKRARDEENLTLGSGTVFQVAADLQLATNRFQDSLRLCFAWEEPGNLTEGVRRFGRVLARLIHT